MNKPIEIFNRPLEEEENKDFLSEIDFSKIIEILRKSILWIIIIVFLSFLTVFIYLRYTKPVFESSSSLRLTIKNEKSIQGIQGMEGLVRSNTQDLAGELEFIRSEVILSLVAKNLGLEVSYFSKGNFLDYEMYKGSPFLLKEFELKDLSYKDSPFFIKIHNEKEFELSYEEGEKKVAKNYFFGKRIQHPSFSFLIERVRPLDNELKSNLYFFQIHHEGTILNYLQSHIKVGVINNDAKIIQIIFEDYNPYKARDIVEEINKGYMLKSLEEKNKSNKQQIEFLDNQLKQYQDSLRVYEAQIQGFFLENKTKNVDAKLEQSIEEIQKNTGVKLELNKQLLVLKELENLVQKGGDMKDFLPTLATIQDTRITTYVNELHQLYQDKELHSLRETENTLKSKEYNKRMQLVRRDILDLIEGSKRVLYNKIKESQLQIMEVENFLLTLPSKGREFNRISRLYNTYESYYNTLLNRKTEIKIAEAGVVPEFIVLAPASLPSVPVSPKKAYLYSIGLAIGAMLSMMLVGLQYLLHNTISNMKELEKITFAPVLGVIPEFKKMKLPVTKMVVNRNPKSSINEALRSIRTNLEFILPSGKGFYDKNNNIIITVTSTVSGEGKTFVASNLGGIIAMSDVKTILLDFDMRRPKLHLAFDMVNEHGVSSILIGKKTIQECIHPTEIENLDVITSGPTPPNPSELILREDFDMMMKELKKTYQLIIIDTPPAGLVTDAVLIMKKAEIQLYVARANYSKKSFGKNINKLIQSSNFDNLAVVLNSVKTSSAGYGNYGGYGKYYSGNYYEDKENAGLLQRLKAMFQKK